MIILLWATLLILAWILYNREVCSRFRKHGIKYFTPVPFIGNLASVISMKKHLHFQFDDLYYAFPDERFVGRFESTYSVVFLRDLELIKQITIKDSDHFIDHRVLVDESINPLFGRNLFNLKSQEWKDMRSRLTPVFTSTKMRMMVPFLVEISDLMAMSVKQKIKESGNDYIDLEGLDLASRYANDAIATCVFGFKVDSYTEANNEFFTIGRETASFRLRNAMVFLGFKVCPWLMKGLDIKLFSDRISNFFKSVILGTIKDREENNIVRPDMIHLLMGAKKEWSDEDLIAQALVFYVAGFETLSTTMSYLLYELACNPDVQDRLLQEIKDHKMNNDGKFDFNSIQNMPYMDMVISEVLRLWPPIIGLDRECVKDYNMGKPNKNSKEDYFIRKGEVISIPTRTIQLDPEYFPDPYKFNPARFSEENKHNIKPFTYMPFGLGPRSCIGSRFSLCVIKVMTYHLLQQMELSACPKTQMPAVLSTDTFNLRIKGGNWLRCRIRH